MEKKVVVALGLSLLVLVGFQLIISKKYPQGTAPLVRQESANTAVKETIVVRGPESPTEEDPDSLPPAPAGEDIIFENKLYAVTFSTSGAGIKKIILNQNKKSGLYVPFEIFNAADPRDYMFLFLPDKTGSNFNNAIYEVERSENSVTFSRNFNGEIVLEKRFQFYNSLYRIDLDLILKNIKSGAIIKEYLLISAVNLPATPMEDKFLEISANIDGKVLKSKKYGKAHEIKRNGAIDWLMVKDRYTAMLIKPASKLLGYSLKQTKSGKLYTILDSGPFTVDANSANTHKFSCYVGPSNLELAKEANIGAESALNYGFLGSIGHLLMSVLRFFHVIFRNWGVAIILLAIFINVILFPLTRKSYKSMQEMQILQPKIEKLRQDNKNNPQKLQKEIMELYKKYKINPMGGCIPLLLQMPIFFALYQGLNNFVDLRGAKFLWISDLSMQENIKLPTAFPLIGDKINILPLVMMVMMFIQQKLTNKFTSMTQTDEQRQQQKFMMVIMTVMFGFIFYSMPSGFVLYWLGSTVIMTMIQSILTKKPRSLEEHG